MVVQQSIEEQEKAEGGGIRDVGGHGEQERDLKGVWIVFVLILG